MWWCQMVVHNYIFVDVVRGGTLDFSHEGGIHVEVSSYEGIGLSCIHNHILKDIISQNVWYSILKEKIGEYTINIKGVEWVTLEDYR